jgi:hypothetical protein
VTIRSTVYLDPGVDDAIIAELERMPFRRRAGRLVQLLRIGAETSLRQRDGTLRGGLVRCRGATVTANTRVRVGIRLSGPADAAVMQLLAESPNRRTERLRQLAQCGLEREAYWTSENTRRIEPDSEGAHPASLVRVRRLDPMLMMAGLRTNVDSERSAETRREARAPDSSVPFPELRWRPKPTGTVLRRPSADAED